MTLYVSSAYTSNPFSELPPSSPIVREKRSDSTDSTDSLDELISTTQAAKETKPQDAGICIFIDQVQSLEETATGPFSIEVCTACSQHVPLVTAPNLLHNALKSDPALFEQIKQKYQAYRHSKSHFLALIPRGLIPSNFKITDVVKVDLEHENHFIKTLTETNQLIPYSDFRALFSEKPGRKKTKISVYVGGHGSMTTKGTVCLQHSQYKDFVQLLDRIFHLTVCFASSCQPRGDEPAIKGILVRRGLPNLDTRADAGKMDFANFFNEANKIDLAGSAHKLQNALYRALTHLDIESPEKEPVIWNPLMKSSGGKPLKLRHRILLTHHIQCRLLIKLRSRKLSHLPMPSHLNEIHLFSMRLPFGLIFKSEDPPAIYSHLGARGVHFIPYVKMLKQMPLEPFLQKFFLKAKPFESNGVHVFFIRHLVLGTKEYYNLVLRISPKEKTECYYDTDGIPKRTLQEVLIVTLNVIQDALPSKEVVHQSSSGQESIPGFIKELRNAIFEGCRESWVKYLEDPKLLYVFLSRAKKLRQETCQIILEICIDHNYLNLNGKILGNGSDYDISETQAKATFKDLLLKFYPGKEFVPNFQDPKDFLHIVEQGKARLVKLFLALNPEFLEKLPKNALLVSIKNEDVEMVRLLLQYKQDFKPVLEWVQAYFQGCHGIISSQMHEIFMLLRDANCFSAGDLMTAAIHGARKELFLPYIAKSKKQGPISLSFLDAALTRNSNDLIILLDQNNLISGLLDNYKSLRLKHLYLSSLLQLLMRIKSKEKFAILCKNKVIDPIEIFNSAIVKRNISTIVFLIEMGINLTEEQVQAIKDVSTITNSSEPLRALGLQLIKVE